MGTRLFRRSSDPCASRRHRLWWSRSRTSPLAGKPYQLVTTECPFAFTSRLMLDTGAARSTSPRSHPRGLDGGRNVAAVGTGWSQTPCTGCTTAPRWCTCQAPPCRPPRGSPLCPLSRFIVNKQFFHTKNFFKKNYLVRYSSTVPWSRICRLI